MKKVETIRPIPEISIISKDFGRIDYFDTYKILRPTSETVDQLTTEIFSMPEGWVNFLMNLRNSIVKVFGLKVAKIKDKQTASYYPVGTRAGLFMVTERNDNEIVVGENDTHLNFRASVLTEKEGNAQVVYLTTIVHYNNFFGRFYFFFVKPFHKIILKSKLKKM